MELHPIFHKNNLFPIKQGLNHETMGNKNYEFSIFLSLFFSTLTSNIQYILIKHLFGYCLYLTTSPQTISLFLSKWNGLREKIYGTYMCFGLNEIIFFYLENFSSALTLHHLAPESETFINEWETPTIL